MAQETPCQTPGALFVTYIGTDVVSCRVNFPFCMTLDEEDAKLLEANIHNAMELALAPWFVGRHYPSEEVSHGTSND